MKNIFPSITKLLTIAACALTLGSCSRANYAVLPKGSSYHGVTRAATPVPVAPTAAATTTAVAGTAATAPKVKAVSVAASVAKAVTVPVAVPVPVLANAAPAPKLTLVQRLALSKVTKKLQKVAAKSGLARQHGNTAATQRLEGKLRQGLILGLIGLLLELVGIATGSGLIYVLGAILILVGIVLVVLYLLDSL